MTHAVNDSAQRVRSPRRPHPGPGRHWDPRSRKDTLWGQEQLEFPAGDPPSCSREGTHLKEGRRCKGLPGTAQSPWLVFEFLVPFFSMVTELGGGGGETETVWDPGPEELKAVGAGRGHSKGGWGPQRHLLILAAWVENCKQPKNFVCLHRARGGCPGPRREGLGGGRGCILEAQELRPLVFPLLKAPGLPTDPYPSLPASQARPGQAHQPLRLRKEA